MIASAAFAGSAILTAWCAAGITAERNAERALLKIPLRILVGGGRGKSTLVKLIHHALRLEHYKTLGRITGEEPTYLLPNGSTEAIYRRGRANVRELRAAVHRAAALEADAIVFENMAVRPELQRLSAQRIVKPTLAAFAPNARDHLDVQPEADTERARMFLVALPSTASIVLPASDSSFDRATDQLASKIYKPTHIDDARLRPFMQELLSIAIATVGQAIQKEISPSTQEALVEKAVSLQQRRRWNCFQRQWIDLMTVNDPVTTHHVIRDEYHLPLSEAILVYTHRRDRLERLVDFAELLRSAEKYYIVGDPAPMRSLKLDPRQYVGHHFDAITSGVQNESDRVFCVGNSRAVGVELVHWLDKHTEVRSVC